MNFQYSHDRFPTQLFNIESCYITRRLLVLIQNKTCREKKRLKFDELYASMSDLVHGIEIKPDDILYEWKMKDK